MPRNKAGVGHPADLPKSYHPLPRGQAWQPRPAAGKDGAPGAARGRAAPGRRDAPRAPACKIGFWAGRAVEKWRATVRTIFLIKLPPSLRWHSWRSAERTSWPNLCGSARSRPTTWRGRTPYRPFHEARSHREMAEGPATDDQDKAARQALCTVCY